MIFVLCSLFSVLYAQSEDPGDTLVITETPIWRHALGGSVIGHPSTQAESVVIISDGGSLNAYSWQGRSLWTYTVRGRFTPFLSRSPEGTSYVCRANGILIAVNRSGRELWQINLGEAITAPVLIGWDGRLVVFTASKISCYTASGFPLWSKPFNEKIGLEPSIDGSGGFYFVSENAELFRISAFGSIVKEQLNAIPAVIAPFKQETGVSTNLLVLYREGNAEIFNTANGSREKINGFPQPVQSLDAAVFDSYSALLQRDGRLSLVSLSDRKILWTENTHITSADLSSGKLETRIVFDERGVFVLSKDGATGFNIEGKRLWFLRIRGGASLPAFSDEGMLYSGGNDWILYAYRLEERVKARKRVLYGPAPDGNYGTGNYNSPEFGGYAPVYSDDESERTLAEIRAVLYSGQTGELEPEYASKLIGIAGSGVNLPRTAFERVHPPVHFTYRCEALRLLSFIGSRETVPFLADLFNRDGDSFVKAAAAEAMGRIGVDPEGLALNAFSRAIFPPIPIHDERALTSVASAAGALCRFSGPPLSDVGIRILVFLAGADKPPSTRRQAEQELKSLSRI